MPLHAYWADLKAPEFRDLPTGTVAVLPLGAMEQHGPHLPVSVDRDLVDAVCARTLPLLDDTTPVLILPTLTVTKSGEHDAHPGTLSLSVDTLLAVLRDVMASVARAGIDRLVLFNGHGGNTAVLEIAVREARITHNLIAAQCSWFGFADYSGLIDPVDLQYDIHAGLTETAPMLAAHPDRVDMSKARDFRPSMRDWSGAIGLAGQPARPGWVIDDVADDGACGDASAATPEAGEQLLSTAAAGFARFLAEFSKFDHRVNT